MRVIGMISGTSLDAIDVAAAEFALNDGAIAMRPLGDAERPWPAQVRARLLAALPPAPISFGEVCRLDIEVGEAFAETASWAVRTLADGRADLVASHGQNVFHWVDAGRARGTLQIGQPACIAERTGLPVVSDLRAADVAAGGQGAPLASTLDALWLASPDGAKRAALNLGGIANMTVVGRFGEPVLAFDTGPANCLMDVLAADLTGGAQSSDIQGRIARSGQVREDLLARLLAEPYYALPPPKSTGRELFDANLPGPPHRRTAGIVGRGRDGDTARVDRRDGGRRLRARGRRRGGRVRRRRAQPGAGRCAAPAARAGRVRDRRGARAAQRGQGGLPVRLARILDLARATRGGSRRHRLASTTHLGADQRRSPSHPPTLPGRRAGPVGHPIVATETSTLTVISYHGALSGRCCRATHWCAQLPPGEPQGPHPDRRAQTSPWCSAAIGRSSPCQRK